MNSKLWIRKSLTSCLMVAMIATYSMVALASGGKTAGEIVVTGDNSNGTAFVTVNGESVKSGRSVFSSSTISTPEGSGAIVNLGKVGRIELAPGTTFTLSFDDNAMSGDLAAGRITVLSAAQSVGVKTMTGNVVLNAGESATAGSATATKKDDDDNDKGNAWIIYALIFGGAAAGIIIAAATSNDVSLGTGTTTISPVR